MCTQSPGLDKRHGYIPYSNQNSACGLQNNEFDLPLPLVAIFVTYWIQKIYIF